MAGYEKFGLILGSKKVLVHDAPSLGFEPRTDRLTGGHSTIELRGNVLKKTFYFSKVHSDYNILSELAT